jgi:hypothetical protein
MKEESDLFPKAKKVLGEEEMEELGQKMQAEQALLEKKGEPRSSIPRETGAAAPLT